MSTLVNEAKKLAAAHRANDPQTKVVMFFPNAQPNQICLLEVSDSAPTTGEVMPFTFAADVPNGIQHSTTVILLSAQEWKDVQDGQLSLPPAWNLQKAEAI